MQTRFVTFPTLLFLENGVLEIRFKQSPRNKSMKPRQPSGNYAVKKRMTSPTAYIYFGPTECTQLSPNIVASSSRRHRWMPGSTYKYILTHTLIHGLSCTQGFYKEVLVMYRTMYSMCMGVLVH